MSETANGGLGGGVFGWLALILHGICYMFGDRLVDSIGLFRRDVLGDLRIVADVVFPTGIDRRIDLGSPNRFDVYYGMADDRIGVARLDLPAALSLGGVGAQPRGKV